MKPDDAQDIEIVEGQGFLEVRFQGDYSLERFLRQTESAIAAALERKAPLLLADLTGLTKTEGLTLLDRYEMGQKAALLARGLLKIAVIGSAGFIDPRKFGARVARNRGLVIDVFTDRAKAVEWLLSPLEGLPP